MTTRDAITFSDMLWPDERSGPWYVRAWWADVGAFQPEPVGVWLWNAALPDLEDPTGHAFTPLGDGPHPVTTTGVRDLNIAGVLAALRVKALEHQAQYRGYIETVPMSPEMEPHRADLLGTPAFTDERPARGRPVEHGPDHYVRVAEVYRAAELAGRPPTKAVADELHGSRSAAAKWVRKARDLGLLGPPPTKPGIAGERRPTDKEQQ